MNTRKIPTVRLILLLGVSTASAADAQDNNYHHQAELNHINSSEDFGRGIWDTRYRYYFTPVSQAQGPYALSGFLAQNSSIAASYSNFASDFDTLGFDGSYVFASRWFIGGGYSLTDNFDDEVNQYNVSGGYYFNDTSAVSASYHKQEGSDFFGRDIDTETYGVELQSFLPLISNGGMHLKTNWNYGSSVSGTNFFDTAPFFFSGSNSDSNHVLSLDADWYFTRALSVGGSYSWYEGDRDDDYSINANYWLRFSPNFAAKFSLTEFLRPDVDGVFVGLGIEGRF